MSGGGLRPTVEAVWLQWPTPGAPSAAIELNGKGAILCVFIFHAAFGEHGDFNSHRDPRPTTTRPSGTAARTKLLPTRALRLATPSRVQVGTTQGPRQCYLLYTIENTIHRHKYHEPYYEWRTTDKKDDGNNARVLLYYNGAAPERRKT